MNDLKIWTQLELLNFYCKQFIEFTPASYEVYNESLKDQMALERLFQVSIETMIDISFHLVKLLKLGVPEDEENIFDLLKPFLDNTSIFKEMKRFRNVIVHRYEKINNNIVYRYATEKIGDFLIFIEEVKTILLKNDIKK